MHLFVISVSFAAGCVITSAYWRHRLNAAMVNLAQVSAGRPVEGADLVIAFASPDPTRAARRGGR